jgi:hypothetical protein
MVFCLPIVAKFALIDDNFAAFYAVDINLFRRLLFRGLCVRHNHDKK